MTNFIAKKIIIIAGFFASIALCSLIGYGLGIDPESFEWQVLGGFIGGILGGITVFLFFFWD